MRCVWGRGIKDDSWVFGLQWGRNGGLVLFYCCGGVGGGVGGCWGKDIKSSIESSQHTDSSFLCISRGTDEITEGRSVDRGGEEPGQIPGALQHLEVGRGGSGSEDRKEQPGIRAEPLAIF